MIVKFSRRIAFVSNSTSNPPEPLEARLGHDEHEQQHGHDPAPVHGVGMASKGRHARCVHCDGNGFQVIVKW